MATTGDVLMKLNGWSCTPEKIMTSNTETPIAAMLIVPMEPISLSVLGRLTKKHRTAVTALKIIVQVAEPDSVFSNLAPTRQ